MVEVQAVQVLAVLRAVLAVQLVAFRGLLLLDLPLQELLLVAAALK
jgi:hypothetical protein